VPGVFPEASTHSSQLKMDVSQGLEMVGVGLVVMVMQEVVRVDW